ncbi:MAG: hypothetical protein ABIZ34_07755 [Candidatus Limnocylindrales bacterium]
MNAAAAPTAGDRGRVLARLAVAGAFAVAAIAGAYLDWIWWSVTAGLTITLAAIALLLLGGIVALVGRAIGRVTIRRIALVVLALGVGLLAGQNLGPSREPLLQSFGGTMTLRLESPVVAVATGPANCTSVASGTEISVSGDPNMRLDTPDNPFVMVYANAGDRWQVASDMPRKNGVRLEIDVTSPLVTGDKPSSTGMQATESSTLESKFDYRGGSISFANLTAKSGPDFTGESMDVVGTLEWTCGAPIQ